MARDAIRIRLSKEIYSADSINKTAYRLSDRLSCLLENSQDHFVACIRPNSDEPNVDHLISEFEKELTDQSLRESIRKETEDERRLILAHVFSKTGMADVDGS